MTMSAGYQWHQQTPGLYAKAFIPLMCCPQVFRDSLYATGPSRILPFEYPACQVRSLQLPYPFIRSRRSVTSREEGI